MQISQRIKNLLGKKICQNNTIFISVLGDIKYMVYGYYYIFYNLF